MEHQYRFGHWGQTSEEILSKQFPLHRACRDGDLEALSLLLVEAQHGIYEEDNFYGWTPAHWASYFGKLNCLMRLLESDLDVDVSSVRLNQTSMHIAAFAGRGHNVKWLLHCGAKIDRQLACLRKLMTTTRVGVNCNIRTSRFKQTPVHLAAFGGHPQCLLWLVSASADLNAQDYLGETALHKASRTGSMECISLLVSHGARLYIRNNSGQTAVELSKSCGHVEVTRYLEQVAQCQLAESGGVYNQDPSPHAITTPSPHDVTASGGLNGGRLPPPGPHGDAPRGTAETDSPMEESEAAQAPCPAGADGPVTDVTTHRGVTANVVSVGGRKRCLEDNEEVDHKRRRSDFSLGYNGVMMNGETNGFHQGMYQVPPTVGEVMEDSEMAPAGGDTACMGPTTGMAWSEQRSHNGYPQPVAVNGNTTPSHRLSTDSIDYSVGYDYSGIPQEEIAATDGHGQMQGMENPIVSRPWSDMSCESAPQPGGHWPAFHNTTTAPQPHQHLILQNTMGNDHTSSPQNGYSMNQPATNGDGQNLINGHMLPSEPVGNGVNGHSVSSWGMPLPTSSVCEYKESVMVEQGYDSMLHEEMLGTRYYSHH